MLASLRLRAERGRKQSGMPYFWIASGFAFAMTYLPVVIARHRVFLARHCVFFARHCERSEAIQFTTIMINKVSSLRDFGVG
jgi:hypothetical protein